MRELHVCLHVLVTLIDRLIRRRSLLAGLCESLLDPIAHRRHKLIGQLVDIAIRQRPICCGNRGIDAARRLEAGKTLALTGAVHSDQRLEKIAIASVLAASLSPRTASTI